jgi:hypothetical protein
MMLQRPYPFLTALTLCALLVGLTGVAEAKEFKFIAQELAKGKGAFEIGEIEIWLPNAVVIDQKEDLKEPLWFVLENPTGLDHEFSVGGLFMYPTKEMVPSIAEMDPITGQVLTENMLVPIRVTVKAGETKKVRVAPVGLAGERSHGASYRFFCPKHKDIRVSGFIFVD